MLSAIFGIVWLFKIPLLLALLIWMGAVNGTFGPDVTSWLLANPGNIIVPAFILWALFKFVGALIGGGSD